MKNTGKTEQRKGLKPWPKGVSGNPAGRPRSGFSIAELCRAEVEKHALIEKLGTIAAGKGADGLRALALVLAYAYGPPRQELALEHSGRIGTSDLARLREVLVVALEGFPEAARIQVAERLLALESAESANGHSR